MEESYFSDDDTIVIKPEARQFELYTSYWHEGRDIGVSIRVPTYTFADQQCEHLTFARERSSPYNCIMDAETVPAGREELCSEREINAIMLLVRNYNALDPIGLDLYEALCELQDIDSGYFITILKEDVDWFKELDTPVEMMIDLLQRRGTLGRAFDQRYLVPSDPPLLTDDIEEAILSAIKISKRPIDLEAQ